MTKPELAFAALIFGSSLQQIFPWHRLKRGPKRVAEPPVPYRSVERPYAKPPPLPPYVPKVATQPEPLPLPEIITPEEVFPLSPPLPVEIGLGEPFSAEIQVLEVLDRPISVVVGSEEPEIDEWEPESEPELVADLPLETAPVEETAVVADPIPEPELPLDTAPAGASASEPVVEVTPESVPETANGDVPAPEKELPSATHPTPVAKEGAAVPDGPPISMRALIAKMNAAARNKAPTSTEIAEKPNEKG